MITLGEGTTIGQYLIGAKIGEGGMGAVYRATHTLLGRPAAIKLLLPALSQQREVVDRLFNEARATTSVSDPGIVSVFDFGFHTDGSAYIVMELLEGEPLDARILRGTISIADALRITRQVAGALGAAHARGIVHRDLKPENIFLVRDAEAQGGERPKILDFGIAKLTRPGDNGDKKRTRTGLLLGTPIYMSPEQCRGAGDVDLRADIYALGCVLYHLVVGRPPFDHEGVGEIISAHLRETPKPPSAVVGGVPAAVDALVLKCLAKDPAQRFQSMQGAAAGVRGAARADQRRRRADDRAREPADGRCPGGTDDDAWRGGRGARAAQAAGLARRSRPRGLGGGRARGGRAALPGRRAARAAAGRRAPDRCSGDRRRCHARCAGRRGPGCVTSRCRARAGEARRAPSSSSGESGGGSAREARGGSV